MAGHLSVGERWRIVSLRFDQSESAHQIKERKEKRASCTKRGKAVMFIIRLYKRMTAGIVEDDSVYHVLSCSAL